VASLLPSTFTEAAIGDAFKSMEKLRSLAAAPGR
jgi:hypothetical protein